MTFRIVKYFTILMGILILVVLSLYIIPPRQQKFQYDYRNLERNPGINAKVGHYVAGVDQHYQVTWGAQTGLQINYFHEHRDSLRQFRLTRIDDDQFDIDGDLNTTEVWFDLNPQDSSLQFTLKTQSTEITAKKNQAPFYRQEEVKYFNDSVRLAALLLTPVENHKSTAIVFIHGSGVSDRDNFWYMHQADYLARSGFVVLLPDKRGCGKSTGMWHTATFTDFAGDIVAALDYLSSHKKDVYNKIGIVGISQGGWISHIVNQEYGHLDFVVDVVSSSTTPNKQVLYEILNDIKTRGVPAFLAKPLSIVFAKRATGRRKIWWDQNGDFDPMPLMAKSDTPTLKIFGEKDKNVPVYQSQQLLKGLLIKHPDLPIEIKIFEGSQHGLMDPDKRWIRYDFLNYLVSWIGNS